MKTNQNTIEARVIEFEKQHGADALLKHCVSVISRILVKKGITTEEEMRQEMNAALDDHLD